MKETYEVKVIGRHLEVDEEFEVEVLGLHLFIFVSILPFRAEIGGVYAAELDVYVSEYEDAVLAEKDEVAYERYGESFKYAITGRLEGKRLYAGIVFEDEDFEIGTSGMNGRYVKFIVDRIDAKFL